jgi:hypothetical protein
MVVVLDKPEDVYTGTAPNPIERDLVDFTHFSVMGN